VTMLMCETVGAVVGRSGSGWEKLLSDLAEKNETEKLTAALTDLEKEVEEENGLRQKIWSLNSGELKPLVHSIDPHKTQFRGMLLSQKRQAVYETLEREIEHERIFLRPEYRTTLANMGRLPRCLWNIARNHDMSYQLETEGVQYDGFHKYVGRGRGSKSYLIKSGRGCDLEIDTRFVSLPTADGQQKQSTSSSYFNCCGDTSGHYFNVVNAFRTTMGIQHPIPAGAGAAVIAEQIRTIGDPSKLQIFSIQAVVDECSEKLVTANGDLIAGADFFDTFWGKVTSKVFEQLGLEIDEVTIHVGPPSKQPGWLPRVDIDVKVRQP